MNLNNLDQWVSTREVAAQLHVSQRRIQQLISDGRLRAIPKGGNWLVLAADLDRLVIEHQMAHTLAGKA